jgi:hypothetical protein
MKVHKPKIIKKLTSGYVLVALPNYPIPTVMSLEEFSKEKKLYP